MKKGYQEILTLFEHKFPIGMALSGVLKKIPDVTSQNLSELYSAGFLNVDYGKKDKLGNQYYKISKDGFSHLTLLRNYHMTKKTKKLTNWIVGLTISLILLGIIQIITFLIRE